MKTLKTMQ